MRVTIDLGPTDILNPLGFRLDLATNGLIVATMRCPDAIWLALMPTFEVVTFDAIAPAPFLVVALLIGAPISISVTTNAIWGRTLRGAFIEDRVLESWQESRLQKLHHPPQQP